MPSRGICIYLTGEDCMQDIAAGRLERQLRTVGSGLGRYSNWGVQHDPNRREWHALSWRPSLGFRGVGGQNMTDVVSLPPFLVLTTWSSRARFCVLLDIV
ncbi:unnamed protein product [Ectocarpus fasciculatus]